MNDSQPKPGSAVQAIPAGLVIGITGHPEIV
jgi:hypothetical protein